MGNGGIENWRKGKRLRRYYGSVRLPALLAAIRNGFENNINTLLEGIVKCSHEVQSAIEKWVNPEKSLKRKRVEEQLQDFQRQKEEIEQKKAML